MNNVSLLDPNNFVVLSCKTGMPFAERVIEQLNRGSQSTELKLGILHTSHFPGGEIKANLNVSVRAKNVHLIQCFRQDGWLNDDLTELLVVLDLLKRSGANKITVYLPYAPYQRQEKKSEGREPISAKLIFDLIAAAGGDKFNRLVTSDMHTAAAAGFANVPVDNLTAWPLFALYVKQILKLNSDEFVIVSPDVGGGDRANAFAEVLKTDAAIIRKKRPHNGDEVITYNLMGKIEGKIAIVIDDMISTAGTLAEAQKLLTAEGATKVFVFATHGLFCMKNGIPAEKRLYDTKIGVVTTDSIPEKHNGYYLSCSNWLKGILSLASYFADAITCNETGLSLSNMMDKHEEGTRINSEDINNFSVAIK